MTSISLISLLIIVSVTIQQTSSAAVDPESAILRTERKKEDLIPNLSALLKKKPSFLDAGIVKKIDREKILAKLRDKNRTKRWVSAIVKAFRYVRKMLLPSKRVKKTRNGDKTTMHFIRRGSFRDAVNDFYRLRPHPVSRFGKNNVVVLVGRIRRYGVTMIVKVRNKSSEGSPTLEVIYKNKIYKFRYKQ